MSHSFNKIWVHAVWSTKERKPLIHEGVEHVIHEIISNQIRSLGCEPKIVNGMPDHIHCLFLLNAQKSIAEVIKQIKGGCSYYVNQNDIISDKFSWQTGYAAFSVSESAASRVYDYIKNQKIHHRGKSGLEEYNAFLKLFGF